MRFTFKVVVFLAFFVGETIQVMLVKCPDIEWACFCWWSNNFLGPVNEQSIYINLASMMDLDGWYDNNTFRISLHFNAWTVMNVMNHFLMVKMNQDYKSLVMALDGSIPAVFSLDSHRVSADFPVMTLPNPPCLWSIQINRITINQSIASMVDSQISSNFRKIPCWIIFRMFHGSIDFRTLIDWPCFFCPSIFGGEGGSFHAPLSRALYLEAAAGEIQGAVRCSGATRICFWVASKMIWWGSLWKYDLDIYIYIIYND